MRKKLGVAFGAVGTAAALSLFGCGDPAEKAPELEPVIEGTFKLDRSTWDIECYGPLTVVRAQVGDSLFKLIANNTGIADPSSMDRSDIPRPIIEAAVAELNDLDNPNVIQAGVIYKLPARCEPR